MSFRRFGGINRAANNNIIRNNVAVTDNLVVTNQVGQPCSKMVIESEFDINNNLNVALIHMSLTGLGTIPVSGHCRRHVHIDFTFSSTSDAVR